MTDRRLLIPFVSLTAAMLCAPTVVWGKESHQRFFKDVSKLMKPLNANDAKKCGLTLNFPALRTYFDQEIGPGCTGKYKSESGAFLSIVYSYGENPNEGSKPITLHVVPVGLDRWIKDNGQNSGVRSEVLTRNIDGVRLREGIEFGDACKNLLRTEARKIKGINWSGWIVEEVYGRSKVRLGACREVYSPASRCIHMVIGNERMSADMGGICLSATDSTSLKAGFSYSAFMEMVKTIRFNEE